MTKQSKRIAGAGRQASGQDAAAVGRRPSDVLKQFDNAEVRSDGRDRHAAGRRSQAGRPDRPRLDRAAARHRQDAAGGRVRQGRPGRSRPRRPAPTKSGGEELAKKIKDGWTDFDVCIAAPDMMGLVGPLGKVLGPRGLMPSPRAGTVTPEVGQDGQGIQGGQGRVSQRRRRHRARRGRQAELRRRRSWPRTSRPSSITSMHMKPHAVKGQYVKSISVSATMSPGGPDRGLSRQPSTVSHQSRQTRSHCNGQPSNHHEQIRQRT